MDTVLLWTLGVLCVVALILLSAMREELGRRIVGEIIATSELEREKEDLLAE